MLTPHEIHHGVILPAFLAVVILLPVLIPKLRAWAHFVLLTALVVPFCLSYMHLFDRPPLPPLVAEDWLFYLAIAAFPVALIVDWSNFRALALPMFFLSSALILWTILRHDHSFGDAATVVSLIAFAGFLSYLSLTELSPRIGGRSMHLMMLLLLAASAQVLGMSGSRVLGQSPLIFAAALLGCLPLVWFLKIPLTSGPLLLIVLLWHAFLICGQFMSALSPLYSLLLIIAPHLAWVGELRARQWPAIARVSLRFAVVLLPMLTAQILAWREFEEAMRELGY